MIALRPGVRIIGIKPELVIAHTIIAAAYSEIGTDCIITSGIEGKHSKGSHHYKGIALDYRTNNMDPTSRKKIAKIIANRLGNDFDVVLESDHLHVEFDPKKPV